MTHKQYLQNIGMELKVARTRQRLTTIELGKITGLTRECINQIESGKNDFKILTVKRIADALNIKLSQLFIFVE